ncbi:MAG: LemA family protein [Acidobacteria bacterium]|nr:LemA family protein [Acidobacteriota bacterium]
MFWAGITLVALAAWLAFTYNRLVALARRGDGAWADIDTQLKRRSDLVPALVETVKGYASHERETLEEVVRRRTVATDSPHAPDAETRAAENGLASAMRGLFALAEDYPELRANDRFGMLQGQLAEIEDALQAARRYYNAVVRDLNTRIATFPTVLVAGLLGFGRRDFFELDSPLERTVPKADLG